MLCFILLLGNFVNVLAQAALKHLLSEDQIQDNKREIWFLSGLPKGRDSEHKLEQQSLGVLAVPPVPSPPAGAGRAAGSGSWMQGPVPISQWLALCTGSSAWDVSAVGRQN